jgi:hypothetical protein
MSWVPHDLGTWGFILSVLAILLMYPVGLLINLTSPVIQNWIATRSKKSLERRIEILENELASWENNPPTTEVEDQILWAIQNMKIIFYGTQSGLVMFIIIAIYTIERPSASAARELLLLYAIVAATNLWMMYRVRYAKGFRWERSLKIRESRRKTITDLRTLRDNWGQPNA